MIIQLFNESIRYMLQDERISLDPNPIIIEKQQEKEKEKNLIKQSSSSNINSLNIEILQKPRFSFWKRDNNKKLLTTPSINISHTHSHSHSHSFSNLPLSPDTPITPIPSAKQHQTLRVIESLLCSTCDVFISGILNSIKHWSYYIRVIIGEILIISQQLNSNQITISKYLLTVDKSNVCSE